MKKEIKFVELRDYGTFMPLIAVIIDPTKKHDISLEGIKESYLWHRLGFPYTTPFVLLIDINGNRCFYDPYDWGTRTMHAHQWLIDNWDSFSSGDVLDVEFILGETNEPKKSEYEKK